jgi:hypothetical protein
MEQFFNIEEKSLLGLAPVKVILLISFEVSLFEVFKLLSMFEVIQLLSLFEGIQKNLVSHCHRDCAKTSNENREK